MTDNRITWDRVDLLVAGMAHSSFPAGSFICPSDQPLFLYTVLERALAACGISEKTSDVHRAMREIVQPHFAKAVEEFETQRRRIIGTLEDTNT